MTPALVTPTGDPPAPDEHASLVADWVAGGYRAAAARGPTAAVMSPATDGGNDELELAPVRVNLIAAGFVDTPLSAPPTSPRSPSTS